MFREAKLASNADGRVLASPIWIWTAAPSGMARHSSGFGLSSFRRPGKKSGFVLWPKVTYRLQELTPGAAGNIDIMRTIVRFAITRSSTGCWISRKPCPESGTRWNATLNVPALTREKVIATVVKLLETTFIRVGNEEYAKENSSFGLTTLRDRHVKIEDGTIRFQFRGKSGQMHDIELHDPRLARIVRECRDLPGYELFQYKDKYGELHSVDSSDVNGYLQEVSGESFTAKDFRTWAGTVQTALRLAEAGDFKNEAEAKRNVVAAIKATAAKLGNRPATCKKYYVHPAVFDAYFDRSLLTTVCPPDPSDPASPETGARLHAEEECVIRLIRKQSAALLDALPGRAA